ncbi:hypothetical protein KH5_13700 [Urechidicola sp. KH5]
MNKHVTKLFIDLNALSHNLYFFKTKISESTKVMAVIKAFGYGSDAFKIANHLKDKVHYFAVAYVQEGVALRKSGIDTPILVLHPQIDNLQTLVDFALEPNLYNARILKAFFKLAEQQNFNQLPVHIKFNTGLNRLGFWHSDVDYIVSYFKNNSNLKLNGVFSHLAASEDISERQFSLSQIDMFKTITNKLASQLSYQPMLHMCNTSGILNYPEAHFDMVRIGIGLHGFTNDTHFTSQLKNVNSLHSIISQIHIIEPGESVGYNRGLIATSAMKTATIPIGHADGILRALGKGKGYVKIKNQKAAFVGNVCMDMIMVDISKIDCTEGDTVVIFDSQEMIEDLAQAAETISYELLTAISQRVERVINS